MLRGCDGGCSRGGRESCPCQSTVSSPADFMRNSLRHPPAHLDSTRHISRFLSDTLPRLSSSLSMTRQLGGSEELGGCLNSRKTTSGQTGSIAECSPERKPVTPS